MALNREKKVTRRTGKARLDHQEESAGERERWAAEGREPFHCIAMRIHSTTRPWPAVVAAAACFVSRIVAANVDDPGQIARDNIIIQFDDSSFTTDSGSDAAVYSVDELDGPVPRTFYWTATKLAPVTDVWLIGEGADYIVHQSPEGKVGMPPATAAVNNVVAAGSKDAKRATSQVKMDVDGECGEQDWTCEAAFGEGRSWEDRWLTPSYLI